MHCASLRPGRWFTTMGLTSLALLCACSRGGGGSPVATPATLSTPGVEFAIARTTADLVVSVTNLPSPAPVMLQLTIELPAALAIAPSDPLQQLQTVATLRGMSVDGHYVIVCGDDRNPTGTPLQNGELFRLRLVTTTPRQKGNHAIVMRQLLVAQNDGTAAPAESNPTIVQVIVN